MQISSRLECGGTHSHGGSTSSEEINMAWGMYGPLGDAILWATMVTEPLWRPLLEAWIEWRY